MRDAYFGSLDRSFVGFTFIDESSSLNRMLNPNAHTNVTNEQSLSTSALASGGSVRSGPGATLLATAFKNR